MLQYTCHTFFGFLIHTFNMQHKNAISAEYASKNIIYVCIYYPGKPRT